MARAARASEPFTLGLEEEDAETAIRVVRLPRPRIADLVALSASSPFWRGAPTGLRSTRQAVFASFPRSGVPPAFRDYAEFARYVEALEHAAAIDDYTRIWWDVRPHPRLGTVEVRAADAVERVGDAVAIAAYVQALVRAAAEAPPPRPPTAAEDGLVREGKWQAVRHGLDAVVFDGQGRPVALRDRILRTLDGLGAARELEDVERIVRLGSGADRQLAVFAETDDVRAVTASIARETAGGYESARTSTVPSLTRAS